MRPLILILLLAAGCVPKREPPATKEECESIIVKLALLGMKEDTPQSEIDELLPIFEKAVAEVHAGRHPEGFPADFPAKIREIESDCQKDFTRRDIECVRAAKDLSSIFSCSLFGP
jgi:hypothetical protein